MNITTTTLASIIETTTEAPVVVPNYLGYLAILVSVIFFGSNYLPVKQYETGDGMFFQLILTTAIWTVGFIVYAIRGYPTFYALPMLGGLFWSTGNLNVVPIIKLIGIGMGTLFWNTILLIVGWAVARFGLLGVHPQVPSNSTLNIIGVGFAIASGVFYLFVRTDTSNPEEQQSLLHGDTQVSTDVPSDVNIAVVLTDRPRRNEPFMESLSPGTRRVMGISLACVSGVLYGFMFAPALYVQDNYENASQNALDYVFSLYTGIYVTSIAYFVIYCIVKRNQPKVYPNVILPGLVSGWMWGCANSLFFLASNSLTQAIIFPIVSSVPSAISALWGIFLYKEIKGSRNFLFLSIGFALTVVGAVLSGISK